MNNFRTTTIFVLYSILLVVIMPLNVTAGIEITIEGRDRSPTRGSFEYDIPDIEPAEKQAFSFTTESPPVTDEQPPAIKLRRSFFHVQADTSRLSSSEDLFRLEEKTEKSKDNRTRNILIGVIGAVVVGILVL
ncbi:MAG: hypothetical protein ACLFN5_07240 [bacterium]